MPNETRTVKFPRYADAARFAVSLHRGNPRVPDGWPKELIELGPAFDALPPNEENGFPGSPARKGQELGEALEAAGYSAEARANFRELTGGELNEIVRSLAEEHSVFILAELQRQDVAQARAVTDGQTQSQIADGFEWDGKQMSLSVPAQLNLMRKAHLVRHWIDSDRKTPSPFPMVFATKEHDAIAIHTEVAFARLLLAADLAIEVALADGRTKKIT